MIRVLIVDDSATSRLVLAGIINGEPGMCVVGAAPDALLAHEMIKTLNPDVLTLDIEMPKLDGLEFLRRLMRQHPLPVLMVSSFTTPGSEQALKALALGAVDCIAKPRAESMARIGDYAEEVRDKIRAAHASRRPARTPAAVPSPEAKAAGITRLVAASGRRPAAGDLIVIGASTGGTEALREVLMALPPDCPGVLVVQHMPPSFTQAFARRLDSLCRIAVKEATHGERVQPGTAYISPGHSHLLLKKSGAGYATELSRGEPVNRHRPSVDVLFAAAAACVAGNAVGVLLTGMGKDGAQGMLTMRRAGVWNIAQNAETCVVYGMPREAVALGAVDETVPLGEIGSRVMARFPSVRSHAASV
jgi:two-component system chemotaxis response regulator CheB